MNDAPQMGTTQNYAGAPLPTVTNDGGLFDSVNDIDKEKLALVKYFKDKSTRAKLADNLRAESFINPEAKFIMSEIKAYLKDNGSGKYPDVRDLVTYSDCHGKKEQMKAAMAVLRVYQGSLMPGDEKSSDKSIETFIKSQTFQHIALNGLRDGKQIPKLLIEMSKLSGFTLEAASGGYVGSDGYSYYDTIESDSNAIASFLPFLNSNMRGGMHKAAINVWLATQGVGKSWMLYKQAFYINKYLKKNVMIVSLEMSKAAVNDRLVSMATGMTREELAEMAKTYGKEYTDNYIRRALEPEPDELGRVAKIYIEQGAARKYSIQDLERKLEDLQRDDGFVPEHIAADYMTLFRCGDTVAGSGSDMYMMGKFLSEDLRSIGIGGNISMDTAAQLGKTAYNNISASHESVGISRAITETADSMIYLLDNELLISKGYKKLSLNKNRFGSSNISRFIRTDFSRGIIEEVDEHTSMDLSNELASISEKQSRKDTW